MSPKVKVLISVVVAVVLLIVGGAATVMAQQKPAPLPEVREGRPAVRVEPPVKPNKPFGYVGDNVTAGLLARVAAILGIPEQDLVSAFKQAQQEMREEALIRWLDKAVAKGRLTQEQADEIKAWWAQRPDVLEPPFLGVPALPGKHMWGGHQFMGPRGRHTRCPGGWYSDNTT